MEQLRRLQKKGKHYVDYLSDAQTQKKSKHEVKPPKTHHGNQQSYKVPDLGFKVITETKKVIIFVDKLEKDRDTWIKRWSKT